MDCPSCGKRVAEHAWICGFCDHILDASVLGHPYDDDEAATDERAPSAGEEQTSLIVWTPQDLHEESEIPEAVILGDVDAVGDFQVLRGAARREDGRTTTFLFYASGATSRTVHPDAVPEVIGTNQATLRTTHEDLILSLIDGVRAVRDIHRASGLTAQDVVVTLLTLLDKNTVRIDGVGPKPTPSRTAADEAPTPDPSEATRRLSPDQLGDLYDDLEVTSSAARPTVRQRLDLTEGRLPMVDLGEPLSTSDGLTAESSYSSLREDALLKEPLLKEPLISSEEVTAASRVPLPAARGAPERFDTEPPQTLELPRPEEKEHEKPTPLDPAFLVEVPPSTAAPAPRPSAEVQVTGPDGESLHDRDKRRRRGRSLARKRAALEAAVKREPIRERKRIDDKDDRGTERKKPQQAVPPAEERAAPAHKKSRPKAAPPNSADVLHAQKLFEQAMQDKADGNLTSAQTNVKLAMTFDPSNELYAAVFDELNGASNGPAKGPSPTGPSRARELYNAATDAESEGDVDRAINLLEQAISHARQPPFLNRLGVILAMRKREYDRARRFVEQARDLAPDNATYERNLHKILSIAVPPDARP